MYATVVSLYSLNIFLTFPAAVYYYHYIKASRASPPDPKRLTWARRRILFYIPICFSSIVIAYWYEKAHNFEGRLKEIEQFYLDRKDQDINEISFTYKYLQG